MDSLHKPQSNFFLSALLIAICFLFTFCDDEDDVNVKQASLIGKWKLVEQKVGIGPPGEWADVEDGGIFEFNFDKSFVDSSNPYCITGTYEINNDTLTLNFDCLEYNLSLEFLLREFTSSSFMMSPTTFMCTEGCTFRYERTN